MKLLFRLFLTLSLIFCSNLANAGGIIRDAEIEKTISEITTPIFRAANLPPENINIYIINDPSVNAFVTGGMNIFIHTGLLSLDSTPEMFAGVMAHETGHISGGHIIKNMDAYKKSYIGSILGYTLGLAAAAAGSPEAGKAIIAGTSHVATRNMLKYTRSHEEAADQAAITYLDRVKITSSGLRDLLTILYNQENSRLGDIDPYSVTHPLSQERISHVDAHIKHSPYRNNRYPENIQKDYRFGIVKLSAFLEKPEQTFINFPKSDQSDFATYARAIAYYKKPELDKALAEINKLIAKYPRNPFFYETKGQFLFENGKVEEAIPFYRKSVQFAPNIALLKIQLGSVLISSENDTLLKDAIKYLEQGVNREKQNIFGWRQLAIAYGRDEQLGMSYLSLTQEAVLLNKKEDVKTFSDLARKYLKAGSPAFIRLEDIIETYEPNKK